MNTEEMRDAINRVIDEHEEYEYKGMSVREIRDALGMSRAKFSREYGIPIRTLESWETGDRTPPEYLMRFMEEAIFK